MSDYYTTLRGTLMAATVGEIFSHSLAIQSNAEPSAVATAVNVAWDAAWAGPGGAIANLYPAAVTYSESTAAFILGLTDGTLSAAYHVPSPAGSIGTNATGAVPSQVALAVSLTAGQRVNGTYLKGRFYLPAPARDQIDPTSGLLNPTTQNAILTAITGFFDALEVGGHVPCVWSRVMGVLQPVQSVRVGNRLDTIRRRRNSSAEVYVLAPR